MTPEQINRLIAEQVMGYEVKGPYSLWYFDPCHRIEHAMMALEKYAKEWTAYKREMADGKYAYSVTTINGLDTFCGNWADTATLAICLACIEAKKLEVRDEREKVLSERTDQ